jgi:hypothetical protein
VSGIKFSSIEEAYLALSQRLGSYDHLMITGGEPTLVGEAQLGYYIHRGRECFKKVTLITANSKVVDGTFTLLDEPDDILYSIHDSDDYIPKVRIDAPVYASIVGSNYYPWMINHLCRIGYSGLSIREEYPDGDRINQLLMTYANFSVKVTRREDCIKGDFLLPDFKLVDGEVVYK